MVYEGQDLLQEVQLLRQISENFLHVFQLVCNKIKLTISFVFFGSTLGLIWRLFKYGSGHLGMV